MKTKLFRNIKLPLLGRGLGGGFLLFCGVVGAFAQNTPPNAASNIIWVIGEQSWSDAIHMPECNKKDFLNSETEPDCRSYTEDGKTWYYYNWTYADKYKAKMCPSPWRVPTKADIGTLKSNSNENALFDAWGYGGLARDSSMSDVNSSANYWSSTEGGSYGAYYLGYTSGNLYVANATKYRGFQIRCVK